MVRSHDGRNVLHSAHSVAPSLIASVAGSVSLSGAFLLAICLRTPDRRIPTPIHHPPVDRNGTLQGQHHRRCRLSVPNRDRARPLPQSTVLGCQPRRTPIRFRRWMARETLRLLRCIPLCHRSLSARMVSVDALRKHSVPEHSHAQVKNRKLQKRTDWRRSTYCFRSRALFFLSFHQNGSSLTLFAKDHTVLSLFGIRIEAPWFQSVTQGSSSR
jgi:hypothetical protein